MPADVLILATRPDHAATWRSLLTQRGYTVAVRRLEARSWVREAEEASASVVVLDAPHVGDVCPDDVRRLRQTGQGGPSVVLVSEGEIEERVQALNAGVDLCLLPRVGAEELVARLTAILRRAPDIGGCVTFQEGGLSLDLLRRDVRYRGRELEVSASEFRVLRELALQVMECRAGPAGVGDDRLTSALHQLRGYVEALDHRASQSGGRHGG